MEVNWHHYKRETPKGTLYQQSYTTMEKPTPTNMTLSISSMSTL